jgi:hypothetical protein
MLGKRMGLDERLARNVEIVLPSGCHVWTGYADTDGYAICCMTAADGKKNRKVHRLVYEAQRGPIPEGMMVCHRCDVRSCVNPDHLFLGSAAENVSDMWSKGRWRAGAQNNKGERNPNARLTSSDVADIRGLRASGLGPKHISQMYGVSRSHVQRVCKGQAWAVMA